MPVAVSRRRTPGHGQRVQIVFPTGSAAPGLMHDCTLGAGALAVFTLLTIPVVNPWWGGVPEPKATLNMISAVHNVSYCGGLLLACILRRYERRER